jgi:hypothetical protein
MSLINDALKRASQSDRDGIHITKIERLQVTVEWNKKVKILTMD